VLQKFRDVLTWLLYLDKDFDASSANGQEDSSASRGKIPLRRGLRHVCVVSYCFPAARARQNHSPTSMKCVDSQMLQKEDAI